MKDAKREAEVVINNIHAEKDATFGLSNIKVSRCHNWNVISPVIDPKQG